MGTQKSDGVATPGTTPHLSANFKRYTGMKSTMISIQLAEIILGKVPGSAAVILDFRLCCSVLTVYW